MRVLVALLLMAIGGCGRSARRNVLLVTIDTLRPDAIGPGTPALAAFLAEATHFPRARTPAPLTLPAHVSMFTGLLPARHGIHDNATAPLAPPAERAFPLLAEQVEAAGYRTAAFVASPVLARATGVASGFAIHDGPETEEECGDAGYLPAEERVKAPLAWMKGAPGDRPWFVWVHLFDPHMPYRPYAGDGTRGASAAGDSPRALYAGDVRRADAALEMLLAAAGPDAIVVLASDHGEALLEHEEPTHGWFCYGSTLDVVLAVRAPGFARGVDRRLRSLADIAPTLRRLCGAEPAPGDGLDLGGPGHETLVSEALMSWHINGWGQCFGVTDGDHSLVESGPRLELFDRREDPAETRPLDLEHPAYEKLDRALERYRDGPMTTGGNDLLPSISSYGGLRRRDARYLPRSENARLLDPRAHVRAWAVLSALPARIRIGVQSRSPTVLSDTLKTLDDLEARTPGGSPLLDHYRAGVCAALASVTGARSWLEPALAAELRAIERGYVQPETIRPAIDYALEVGCAGALEAIARRVNLHRVALDAETRSALEAAAARLRVAVRLDH
jgi:arylsulfatase A-like enzyme